MKKLKFLILASVAAALSLSLVACEDDEEDVDMMAPVVAINSPADNAIVIVGEDLTVNATITDNVGLASISMALKDGSGNAIIEQEETVFTDPVTYVLEETVTVPGITPPGTYTLEVNATDAAGNQADMQSVSVEVQAAGCTAEASCVVAGQTTFVVTAPASTPADSKLYLVGEMSSWQQGDEPNAIEMTKIAGTDNCYCVSVDVSNVEDSNTNGFIDYKITRGSWDNVEKTIDCGELDNRSYTEATNGNLVEITVEEWRDICE